jgi:hypothetical protein
MSTDTPSPPGAHAGPPDLFDFFERVRTTNPFLSNRVDRALDPSLLDVSAIHEAAFERVVGLGRQAFAENRGVGVVVWGEAGVGKTHLLARLNRWPVERPAACPVYLHNLQASPERLPRYVLRSVLSALTRGQVRPFAQSPLFSLMNAALAAALNPDGKARGTWGEIEAAHAKLVARLAARDPSGGVLFDRIAHDTLFSFYRHAHPSQRGAGEGLAALAVRWLAGDTLHLGEARHLGLPLQGNPADPVSLADNQHIKQVFVALTQVARAAGRLFLLSLDQVDNLDTEQVRALSRFLHDLLDSAGNLLIVTTGVQNTLLRFLDHGIITETSWDRIGQFTVPLGRLRREQGWELLRAHLLRFLEPVRGVKEVEERLRQDPLFPLGVAWFDARLRDLPDFRPRDLLGWAGERWQRLQDELAATSGEIWIHHTAEDGKPPPPPPRDPQEILDEAVTQKVAEYRARFLSEMAPPPFEEDRVVGLLDAALKGCQDGPYRLRGYRRHLLPKSGPRPAYDLTVEQAGAPGSTPLRVGVRVLAAENSKSVTTVLERIGADTQPPGRVLLLTDERQNLPLGPKGAEWLQDLEARGPQGFRRIAVSPPQLADLEALQAVVGLARAGDFEIELGAGQRKAVTEDDVIASHRRAGRYPANSLLRELLGGEVPAPSPAPDPAPVPVKLDEQDARQFVAAQTALSGQVSLDELAVLYTEQHRGGGQPPLDLAACRAALRQVALRLADEGLLQVANQGDGLSLRPPAPTEAAVR